MSKTKGNVIDPIDIIQRFGTDAVRFTLASMASPGTDIAFSEARTEGYRAFANKIWNAARFIFMNIDRACEAGINVNTSNLPNPYEYAEQGSATADRWITGRLSATVAEVTEQLEEYRYDLAANAIYKFFWNDFCDWYLELVKLRLVFGDNLDRASTTRALTTLIAVFESTLRLLSPFMPFITEEIWHALYEQKPPARSIALASFPRSAGKTLYLGDWWRIVVLQEFLGEVRALRKELSVPEKEYVECVFYPDPLSGMGTLGEIHSNRETFLHFGRLSGITISQNPLTGAHARSTSNFDVQVVYERMIDVAAERERLTRDLAKYEKGLLAAERQLSNEAFMARAPAHIVEGLKKQAAETQLLYDKTKAALGDLGPA
jgi:valyl-tRNA synthetase